ncbi:hypothetical protein [Candidatus Kryptobacter tengchongensis]|uniref:hypothetical protein n=1 Tax=Kryptobacter tengchongensis TaxID=1643429 RepID=UPI000707BD62|nr:hypothetical protein [Candidatus Kryptobacter tengchongensis]CUS88017.1 hypothetical protein JGI20_01143 [Candidatus Kryptobacter tengchongensis]
MKISDEQLTLINLYKNAKFSEKLKIYARIIFNFNQIKNILIITFPNQVLSLTMVVGMGFSQII